MLWSHVMLWFTRTGWIHEFCGCFSKKNFTYTFIHWCKNTFAQKAARHLPAGCVDAVDTMVCYHKDFLFFLTRLSTWHVNIYFPRNKLECVLTRAMTCFRNDLFWINYKDKEETCIQNHAFQYSIFPFQINRLINPNKHEICRYILQNAVRIIKFLSLPF